MNHKLTTLLPITVLAAVLGLLLSTPAMADQVIADDLIVQGSLCVGVDCVNGENFGFDTIRLKENNLRIKFQDTSVGTFPTTDWELTANDSASGGAGRFSIRDIDAARDIFTVRAGATANSIFVSNTGRVGFRTATPVLDLHINTSNTPAIRLEQNNSGGFSAQSWDVAGNEAGFFIRDATNGSQLPFRIQPGTASNTLFLSSSERVGVNTLSPAEELDIHPSPGTDNEAELAFHNDDTAHPWVMRHRPEANGGFFHFDHGGGAVEFALSPTGSLTLLGGLTIGISPCSGCDQVFQPSYEVESIEAHAASMWENSYLPGIGPTPDGKAISVDVGQKTTGMLNELEKAHIYIDRLNEELKTKAKEVDELKERMARLEKYLGPRQN